MKGPFVIVLAGVPLYLKKKMYPQRLLVFSKRRWNGAVCTSHFPVRHWVVWHKEAREITE